MYFDGNVCNKNKNNNDDDNDDEVYKILLDEKMLNLVSRNMYDKFFIRLPSYGLET